MSEEKTTCGTIPFRTILDGRTFWIPDYQRGYRWGKNQIFELLNDLFEFILKGKKENEFYCLQPIIVKKISDEDRWEVVDGQQRLTSLYLLYRYLLVKEGIISEEDQRQENGGLFLYHIKYETRPQDDEIIEKIGLPDFTLKYTDLKDIDIVHIYNAYRYVEKWFSSEDREDLLKRFDVELSAKDTRIEFLKLLNCNPEKTRNAVGSVQFVWQNLGQNCEVIKEFTNVNKGKIPLTSTELVKAMILQKKNFNEGDTNKNTIGELKQQKLSNEWEFVENTLHKDEFWQFLYGGEKEVEDNRIDALLRIKYDNECLKEEKKELPLDKFYAQKLNEADVTSEEIWEKQMEAFRQIQNWYGNPRIYNYVGLLIRLGVPLNELLKIYDNSKIKTLDDFILGLQQKIFALLVKSILGGIQIKTENGIPAGIQLFYDLNKKDIANVLHLVNAEQLNRQVVNQLENLKSGHLKSDKKRSERDCLSPIYRYPYDVIAHQEWDVEHVDSATTNKLVKASDQYAWIDSAIKSLNKEDFDRLNADEDFTSVWNALKDNAPNPSYSEAYKHLIELIQYKYAREDDDSKDCLDEKKNRKNWIGNLVLLDTGSNRSYHNDLFVDKQRKIQERVKLGMFIPVCTQKVFNKTFNNCTSGAWTWDKNDKYAYHDYLFVELVDFSIPVIKSIIMKCLLNEIPQEVSLGDLRNIISKILKYLKYSQVNGNQIVSEFGKDKWTSLLEKLREIVDLFVQTNDEDNKSLEDEMGELENENK